MPQIDISGGSGFMVDLAEGERFAKVLEKHRDTLRNALNTHGRSLNVLPPGNDDYSREFAHVGNHLIKEHRDWNVSLQDDLQSKIDHVRAQLKTYAQVEQDNTFKA